MQELSAKTVVALVRNPAIIREGLEEEARLSRIAFYPTLSRFVLGRRIAY